jgi:guanylate kinase
MGKSGCGKSTLERNLILQYPNWYKKVVSSTTRPIREGETNGEDYYFLSDEEYDKTDFIQVTEFAGHRYGSAVSEYLTPHQYPILCVVPSSAKEFTRTITERFPDWGTYNIYFDISDERLMENMRSRGDSDEMIDKRISQDTLDQQFYESGLMPHFVVEDMDLNGGPDLAKTVATAIGFEKINMDIRNLAKFNHNF